MTFTVAEVIKITAEAIRDGIKPYKLIENPSKILSGETKQIVISKKGKDIRLAEEIIDQLINLGEKIDKKTLSWKTYHNIPNGAKYTIFQDRGNTMLIKLIEAGTLKDLRIVNVPIEEWSWGIEITNDIFSQEYIAYFI